MIDYSPSNLVILTKLVMDICQDEVTDQTVATAVELLNLGFEEFDFIHIIAGANLENLPEARNLALEELERLTS